MQSQELYWHEKSRVKWQLEGDRNKEYFHKLTKVRNVAKQMNMLKHGDDILNTASQIENHVVSYFQDIFCTKNNCVDDGLVEEVIPNSVSIEDNQMLLAMPSVEEVRLAVFGMNLDGAPGPDGFGASFYQFFWEIIGVDVFKAVS